MERLLVVWKDFLWIWKDLGMWKDLKKFLGIWENLEGFGKVSWDLEGFPCPWKGLEGLLVNAGMGNLPEKGAVISLLKDYWLPCHRVDRM